MLQVSVGGALLLLLIPVVSYDEARDFVANSIVLATSLTVWVSHRRRAYRQAVLMFCWGAWSAIVIQALIAGGLFNGGVLLFPALVLISGWLLGTRHALGFTLASIAASLFIGYVVPAGDVPDIDLARLTRPLSRTVVKLQRREVALVLSEAEVRQLNTDLEEGSVPTCVQKRLK